MDANRLKQIIEGALLAAGQTLDVKRILELFANDSEEILHGKVTAEDIETTLEAIVKDCEGRGFELKQVSSGWRFQVREETAQWVNRLWEEKPQKYSRAMLETLALIAYRQPITRGDIEEIRGVAVSSHIIKTLSERDWVKVIGHRDVPGRPSLYATTKTFLDYFNLKSLEELPSLGELADIEQLNSELNLEIKPENAGENPENSVEEIDNNGVDATVVDGNIAAEEANVSEQSSELDEVNFDESENSENIEAADVEQISGSDSTIEADDELLVESDIDETDRAEAVVDEEISRFVATQDIDNSQIESVESEEFESDALDAPDLPAIEVKPSSVEMESQDQLVDDEESEEDEKPVEHKAKSLFDIS